MGGRTLPLRAIAIFLFFLRCSSGLEGEVTADGEFVATNLSADFESPEDLAPAPSDSEYTFLVEHSFDSIYDGPLHFAEKTYISVKVPQDFQSRKDYVAIAKLKAKAMPLSADEIAKFMSLVETDGLYYLRVRANPVNSEGSNNIYVQTAVPICSLIRSGLREEIHLRLDSTGGRVTAVEYRAPVSYLAPQSCSLQSLESLLLRSGTSASTNARRNQAYAADKGALMESLKQVGGLSLASSAHIIAPVRMEVISKQAVTARPPPDLVGVKGVDKAAEKPAKQEKSFLQRYWYVFAIAAFFFLTGGAQEEPKAGQGQAGAAGGGGASGGASGGGGGGGGGGGRAAR